MMKHRFLYLIALNFTFFACTESDKFFSKNQNAAPSSTIEIANAPTSPSQDTNVVPSDYVPLDSARTVHASLDSPSKSTKYIYFTVDDGPSSYSDDILNLAKDKNVKMTVFLVGINMKYKAFDKEFSEYRNNPLIEMCNHSYSHANNRYEHFYRNPDGVLMDFYKNIVTLNLTNSIARFPGSPAWMLNGRQKNVQTSRKNAATLLKDKGFRIFGWDSEWEFSYRNGAPKGTAESVLADIESRIKNNDTFVKNHCVLLLHERMFQKKIEIARLVTLLQQKGYVFEHLRNFPKT
jgi:peptidoglycan/xylan/chitin deacetylase (PgdA/CDA1 family)